MMRRVAALAVLASVLAACDRPSPEPDAAPMPSPVVSASPSPSPSPSPTPTPVKACELIGQYQREVETALAQMGNFGQVTVDGIQTEADCTAIKAFQQRFDLRPVDGIAGPATHGVAQRLLASVASRCEPARWGVTACVDLTNQTTWLMRGGRVIHGPTVTRTGMKHFATPPGAYTVDWKALKDWSVPYKVWLPYWQSFNDDIGFHETTSYIHNGSVGSHGCVNLLPADALKYWNDLDEGSSVVVFGRRPGT